MKNRLGKEIASAVNARALGLVAGAAFVLGLLVPLPARAVDNPAGAIYDNLKAHWMESAPMTATREMSACAVFSNALYVIGGYDLQIESKSVFRFDGASWTPAADLPEARTYPGAGVLNDKLYALGGINGGQAKTEIFQYDGASWSASSASLPQGVYKPLVVTLGGNLYSIGGRVGGDTTISNVYAFDGATVTDAPSLPFERAGMSGGVLNGYLYAVGGRDNNSNSFTNVYRFDGTNWTEAAGLPAGRYDAASTVADGYLYIMGGSLDGDSGFANTNVFRFDGTNWTEVAGLPQAMCDFSGATLNGAVHALAGYDYSRISQTNVYRFIPEHAMGVLPAAGNQLGGYSVTISGTNLCAGTPGDVTNVTLCGVAAASIDSASPTQIVVTAAVGSPGTGAVRVFSAALGQTVRSNAFTYVTAPWHAIQGPLMTGPGLAAGRTFSLALKLGGSIVGWGDNDYGQTNAPATNANFISVAGGWYYSMGLRGDGSIVAWGDNYYGQTNVPTPNADFVAIAAGQRCSLGLKRDGSIVGWGYNGFAQASAPADNTGFVAIAAGGNHSLGLKSDGTIVAWGCNNNGESTVPADNTDFAAIAAGGSHSLGLKRDGSIVAWGNNDCGQTTVPAPNADFVAIAGGYQLSLGLKRDGSIVAWGDNYYGQTNVPAPNADFGFGPAILPSSGSFHGGYSVTILGSALCDGTTGDVTRVALCGVDAAVLSVSGSTQIVVTAGAGTPGAGEVRVVSAKYGEVVRSNAFTYVTSRMQVITPEKVVVANNGTAGFGHAAVGASLTRTFAVTNSGEETLTISGVTITGADAALFQCSGVTSAIPAGGAATFAATYTPDALSGHAAALVFTNNSAATPFTLNLTAASFTRSGNSGPFAGGNALVITNGVAFGTITNVLVGGVPAAFTQGADGVVTVTIPAVGASGVQDIVVQTPDSGDITLSGAYTVRPAGVIRGGLMPGPAIAAGMVHSLGLKGDGHIVAWGQGNYGSTNVPDPNTNFVAVAAAYYYSLGLKSDGSIAVWGNGYDGYGLATVPDPNTNFVAVSAGYTVFALGLKSDGSIVAWGNGVEGQTNVPAPNADFVAVSAGANHSLGLKSDGHIVGWGANTYGALDVPEPNTNFVAVSAGAYYSLGLKSDGSIVAWGYPDGRIIVPEPNTDFVAISAGYAHALGLKRDGSIVAWGDNYFGQTNVPAPNADFVAVAAGVNHSLGLKSDGSIVAWGSPEAGKTTVPEPNANFGMGPSIEPSFGNYQGGYQVVIHGTNLCDGTLGDVTHVTLGGVEAAVLSVSGSTQIVVTAGVGAPGTGDVHVVSTFFGETVRTNGFTYMAPELQVQGSNGNMASGDAASLALGTDFSEHKVGSSETRTFYLYNGGTETLVISNANLAGPGAAQFQVAGMPATLDAGASGSFTVTFQPAAVESFAAALVISNNAPSSPFIVNFAGTSFAVSLNQGPFTGGNTITLTNGAPFGTLTNVLVGGAAAQIVASGTNWVTIVLPSVGSSGLQIIVVQTDIGDITLPGAYLVNRAGRIGSVPPAKCWVPDSGLGDRVAAVAVNPTNGHMFAGGSFYDNVSGEYYGCAEWDGATWTLLTGAGIPLQGNVGALAFNPTNGHLFAGGSFFFYDTNISDYVYYYCAEWDGSQWSALAGLTNNVVFALAIDPISGALVAGGVFDGHCAQWNPTNAQWDVVGTGDASLPGIVQALAFNPTNGALYAAGYYYPNTNRWDSAAFCAQWDPVTQTWKTLGDLEGSSNYGYILALAIDPQTGALVAGGSIWGSAYCAQWDEAAQQWNPMGNLDANSVGGSISALTFDPKTGRLVAGGYDNDNGVGYCAAWNGATWNNMGSFNSTVYALTENPATGNLVAGGDFNGNFAEWKVPTWTTFDGLNNSDNALITDPATGHIFAGGWFDGYCAEWDGSQWNVLGNLDGGVAALAIDPATGHLIAGGNFSGYCAEWNGTAWTTLGALDSDVYALTFNPTNGNLIAGGYFSGYCAEWNGSQWNALAGLNNEVDALTVNPTNGNVVAGGWFDGYCAEWNGSEWTTLGALDSGVKALTVATTGHLIAGGYFSDYCAEWDGTQWNVLAGLNSRVNALTVNPTNGNVIAGGRFSGYCAEWNGTAWTTLGGLDGSVNAITMDPATGFVVLGGNFSGYCEALGVVNDPGVAPASGSVDGGFQVVITGVNLGDGTDVTAVTLCGVPVASVSSQSATQIVVVAAAGTPGTGDVRVVSTSFGETLKVNAFTYAINQATPTATLGVGNTPTIYSGSPQAATVTIAASSVPGTVGNIRYAGSATAPSAAATYAVTADFVPNDTTNYGTLTGLAAGNFVITLTPSVRDLTVTRLYGKTVKIALTSLQTNWTTATGDVITVLDKSATSTNGSSLTAVGWTSGTGIAATNAGFRAAYISYPTNGPANDSFTYRIQGGNLVTVTGTVHVVVSYAAQAGGVASLSNSNGTATVKFLGRPGNHYSVQRSSPTLDSFSTIDTIVMPATGYYQYTDPEAPNGSAYYRLAWDPTHP